MFRSLFSLRGKKSSARRIQAPIECGRLQFDVLEERSTPAAFTPGNLVVAAVGDGINVANAAIVNLREYTPTGTLIQTIAMPTATTGPQFSFRQSITATSEANLNLSGDGRYLTLTGYDAANAEPIVGANRMIGRVDAFGNVDTSTASSTVYANSNIRAAVTYDGSQFWTAGAGTSAYIRHFGALGLGANTDLASGVPNSTNTRNVTIGFDGRLYYGTSAGSAPGPGIYQFATPRPTAPSAETRIIAGAGSAGIGGIVLIDMDANGSLNSGDQLYFADDALGIRRSIFDGASWGAPTTALAATALRGLTGVRASATSVQLFGTTFTTVSASTSLISFLDDGVNTTATPIATTGAGSFVSFRGIAMAPSIATTIAIADYSPNATTVATPVTFQATITAVGSSSTAPASGTVEFRDGVGGAVLATASFVGSGLGRTVTVTTSVASLPAAAYNVVAVFLSSGSYVGSASASTSLTVSSGATPTTTTLNTIGQNPADYGSAVAFSGTVSGSANGTIFIRAGGDAGTLLATGAVSGGTFTVSSATTGGDSPSPIAAGTYSSGNSNQVTAYFVGASGFADSNSAGQDLTVTKLTLTLTGLIADNKSYDGTTAATVTGTPALSGVLGGDTVNLDSVQSYAFDDAGAGIDKIVRPIGVTISGSSAANYLVTGSQTTATITPKLLTISGLHANHKPYDGTTAATASGTPTLVGIVSGDTVYLGNSPTYTFLSANAGFNIPVSVTGFILSGPSATNYELALPFLTATILRRELTVTGLAAQFKTYDGTSVATLTGTPVLEGDVVSGETIVLVGTPTGSFGISQAFPDLSVNVTGLTISGPTVANYQFTPPTLYAGILRRELHIVGLTAHDKIYDGELTAVVTGSPTLTNVVAGDIVQLGGTPMYVFVDQNVGNNIPVIAVGFMIAGDDAENYFLDQGTMSASITRRLVTITGLTADDKVYDATTAATVTGVPELVDVVAGENVYLGGTPTYAFADANAGFGKPVTTTGFTLSGPNAANYQLAQPTLSADITKAPTTTTVTATPQATTGGMLVAFEATVHITVPGTGILFGTIEFFDGTTLIGSQTINTLGVAAFTTSVLTIGIHPVAAVYSGDSNFSTSTSSPVETIIATQPRVLSVTVNGDNPDLAGAQRSRVASLKVAFDQPVSLDADAFTLDLHRNQVSLAGVNLPDGFGSLPTSLVLDTSDSITWIVTFAGNTDDGEVGTGFDGLQSIKNGVYDFKVEAAKVHPVAVSSIGMAADSTTVFHRYFGDFNGAETPPGGTDNVDFVTIVAIDDNFAFRSAFNSSTNYRADFDFNGDGVIGIADNFQLRSNFNKALIWRV